MKVRIDKSNIDEYINGPYPEIESVQWLVDPLCPHVLSSFPNLRDLDCSNCGLTSLDALDSCPQLESLCCSSNKLLTLTGIEKCKQLQVLDCGFNDLVTLKPLFNLQHLAMLASSNNPWDLETKEAREFKTRLEGPSTQIHAKRKPMIPMMKPAMIHSILKAISDEDWLTIVGTKPENQHLRKLRPEDMITTAFTVPSVPPRPRLARHQTHR